MRQLLQTTLSESERAFEVFFARNQVASFVHVDPVAARLYTSWYREAEPEGKVKFSISDVAAFCLLAAASGIVGNATYDALKAFVLGLRRKKAVPFDKMVTAQSYEELRRELHVEEEALLKLPDDVQLIVRRRYSILVEDPKEAVRGGVKRKAT